MSAYLFTLLTNTLTATVDSCTIIKYADDTAIIGKIIHGDETAYRKQIQAVTDWCSNMDLIINVSKTKELHTNFRELVKPEGAIVINDKNVDIVDHFKYLGVTITSNLSWSAQIDNICKKSSQRLYFLRKLRQAKVDTTIMKLFYQSIVQSVFMYCLFIVYHSLNIIDKSKLQRIIRRAKYIMHNDDIESLESLIKCKIEQFANKLEKDTTHPLSAYLELLPSGRCYRQLKTVTSRFKNSIMPTTVNYLNGTNYLII